MAKSVFNGREIAHIWASRKQESGRAPNVFFSGPVIYSYGRHFPMGVMMRTKEGGVVAILTTRTYYNTTSKHLSRVRQAVNHLTRFHLPLSHTPNDGQVNPDNLKPSAVIAAYRHMVRGAVKSARDKTAKGYVKYAHYRTAGEYADTANDFAQIFGLKTRLSLTPAELADMASLEPAARAHDDAMGKRAAAREERNAIKYAAQNAAYERQRLERAGKVAAQLEEWMKGERGHIEYAGDLPHPYARVSADGTTVETTMGATVPEPHARRAYRTFAELRRKGQTYHKNGTTIHVGVYDALEFNGETLVIGCHKFPWSEVERLATFAGWNDPAPAPAPAADAPTT